MATTTLPLAHCCSTQKTEQSWLFQCKEKLRLKLHLLRTELALRKAKQLTMTPDQLAQRSIQLDVLHRFWVDGRFPRNVSHVGQILPSIQDDRGQLCAMAHLIAESGAKDLVNDLYQNNNHIYINAIHEGPILDWLHQHGLTQAEAARIQPSYPDQIVLSAEGIRLVWVSAGLAALLGGTMISYWIFRVSRHLQSHLPKMLFTVLTVFNGIAAFEVGLLTVVDERIVHGEGAMLGILLVVAISLFTVLEIGAIKFFRKRLHRSMQTVWVLAQLASVLMALLTIGAAVGSYSALGIFDLTERRSSSFGLIQVGG